MNNYFRDSNHSSFQKSYMHREKQPFGCFLISLQMRLFLLSCIPCKIRITMVMLVVFVKYLVIGFS